MSTTGGIHSLSPKSRAALAVSLWTASGGVAGAWYTNLYIDSAGNIQPATGYPEGASVEKTGAKELTIVGGTWGNSSTNDWWHIGGGGVDFSTGFDSGAPVDGYTLKLENVTYDFATSFYGGVSRWGSGTVSNNRLIVGNGCALGEISGGQSQTGTAENNEVVINGGRMMLVQGGYCYAGAGDAIGNRVEMNGGAVTKTDSLNVAPHINGGRTQSGNALDNEVVINAGQVYAEGNNGHDLQSRLDAPRAGQSVAVRKRPDFHGGNGNSEAHAHTNPHAYPHARR